MKRKTPEPETDPDPNSIILANLRHQSYLACAGRGKTEWIVEQMGELCGLGVDDIELLGFSFTNQAADTLRDRVKQRTGYVVDVMTMHAWCNKFKMFVNHGCKLEEGTTETAPRSHVVCLSTMVSEVLVMERDNPTLFEQLLQRFEHRSHVFVDESQDCSVHQFQLIRLLCRVWQCRLVLVGDPNQSVFGFQGAVPRQLLTFFDTFPAGSYEIIRENDNWRSSSYIISAVNLNLMRMEGDQVPMVARQDFRNDTTYDNSGLLEDFAEPRIAAYTGQREEANDIGGLIWHLVNKHGVAPNEIVILNRYRKGLQYIAMILMEYYGLDVDLAFEDGAPGGPDSEYRVQLRTMHSCKGGTWDFAFMTGMSDENPETELVGEEQRLFHVSMTRARRFLHISYVVDTYRRAKLTRFITSEDLEMSGCYQVTEPNEQTGVVSPECWGPEDSAPPRVRTREITDLYAELENSVGEMPVEAIQDIVKAINRMTVQVYQIPIPEGHSQDPEPPTTLAFPSAVRSHNMGKYFSSVVEQMARISCRGSAKISLSREGKVPCDMDNIIPAFRLSPSVLQMVLLPPIPRAKLDLLHRVRRESELNLSWNVSEWDLVKIAVTLDMNESEFTDLREAVKFTSRSIEGLAKSFDGREHYATVRSHYGLDGVIGRKQDTLWDRRKSWKTSAKTRFSKCRGELCKLHKGINSGDLQTPFVQRNAMLSVMKLTLLGDFIAFSRSHWQVRGFDSNNVTNAWSFSLEECANAQECDVIFEMINAATNWVRNECGSASTHPLPSCVMRGNEYSTVFDHAANGMYFVIDCDLKERDSVPVHKVMAALLCLPIDDDRPIQRIYFMNLYTGGVQCFSLSSQQVREFNKLYEDTVCLCK